MKVVISPRKVVQILLLGLLLLSCASVAGHFLRQVSWVGEDLRTGLRPLFDTTSIAINDKSIGTWYSSFLLLFSSVLLAIIARAKKAGGEPYSRHWAALSIIFLFLSIDEVATLHEALGSLVDELASIWGFTLKGFFSYGWIVLGVVFVLIVLLSYLKFLYHLPKKTLLLFLGAGALFVGSALGFEMLEAEMVYVSERGADVSNTLLLVNFYAEEVIETGGEIMFIYALLSYMRSYVEELNIHIGLKDD
jgi:hypothetical protein